MNPTEQYDGIIFLTNMTPRMEYCEDQNRTIVHIRAVQGRSPWCQNPTFFSLKHILHTGSSSNCKSILENGLWAGGLSLKST